VAPIIERTWDSSSTTKIRAGLRSRDSLRASAAASGFVGEFGAPIAARFNAKQAPPKFLTSRVNGGEDVYA